MENLKAIIVFLLFWSIAIWCVRVVKRKHKKQIMKFSEELPEMELVTDEEEKIHLSINKWFWKIFDDSYSVCIFI